MSSALAFALLTVVATSLGGAVALRAGARIHLALGLAAGALLGLVLFELVPEVLELTDATVGAVPAGMAALVVGFLLLHVVEQVLGLHHAHGADYADHRHRGPLVGVAAAGVLAAHAFVDGLSIGLAFAVDERLGVAVGVAVVAHRFADGLTTVAVMRIRGGTRKQTLTMLALSTVAPVFGVLIAERVAIDADGLALLLGLFAGVLLYLATNDVLPEAHRERPSRAALLATVAGVAAMGLVVTYG